MKTILQGWNFMRILRFTLGMGILIQGITAKEGLTIALGLAFAGMAIANIGCCGAGGCAVNSNANLNKTKHINYDEVVSKK